MQTQTENEVLGMVQMLIRSEVHDQPLTREILQTKLDQVLALNPRWRADADHERILAELEARFSIWIGEAVELVNDDDHIPWLSDRKPTMEWRYWSRYRLMLQNQIAQASLDELDSVTDRVLSHLENPDREGPWDRRGLVVGHVQSGKTANYAGLICKAADAGYKIIIVLAGLHNNLRSQTQIRLEEAFLGYESIPPGEPRAVRPTGVGLINPDPVLRPDAITNRSESGDFNRAVAQNFSINPGGRPLLFVLKKHSSVLRNLIEWVEWAHNARDSQTGRQYVSQVPLLVIDDEADNASVDTKEQAFDEEGNPDADHDPTTINRRIRRLLMLFDQRAYVGYTATPFANIFIHESGETELEGPDLFPRSFIVNLTAPSDYFGPSFVFGSDNDDPENEHVNESNPYIREVADHADSLEIDERSGWMPPRHRNGHRPLYLGEFAIPPSLREAIQAFVLSTAARRARGQIREHNSMLVHVSRFTSVQHSVREQITAEVTRMRREIRYREVGAGRPAIEELRELWESDFEVVSQTEREEGVASLSWAEIESHVVDTVSIIEVREINGSAGDVLDYAVPRETGLVAIAIGGDKLSRGLTLEGLTVSYFLRASRMYDTLMQMGRWFGYRRGYRDLCRIYMPGELNQWFERITEAAEELREEFDHMAAVRGTPRNYGLRVRSHPALLITSRVKMRTGTEMRLSYAGAISETTIFHRAASMIEQNQNCTRDFLECLGMPIETDPERERPDGAVHRWRGSFYWSGINSGLVTGFLGQFATHEDADRANSYLLRDYIQKQNDIGNLANWNIALLSGSRRDHEVGGLSMRLVKRQPHTRHQSIQEQRDKQRFVIRRLLSPRDEAIDLNLAEYTAALEKTREEWHHDPGRSRRQTPPDRPSGTSIRSERDQQTGLLLLYLIDPNNGVTDGELPVVGFGISFPNSTNAVEVTYRVNNVFMNTAEAFG